MPLPFQPTRILHTMLRVSNLEQSLAFYTGCLGMRLLRRVDHEAGRFTLTFLGYDEEESSSVVELTHNWDEGPYDKGTAFGHIALAVADIEETCTELRQQGVAIARKPGPVAFDATELIAFIEDPDGHRIELIERA